MFRSLVSVVTAAGMAAACATPETTARYNATLEKCLASADVMTSNDCKKAELLRQQMELERQQNTSVALGAATVGLFTLGAIAVFNDCCYRHHYHGYRPYKHRHYGHGRYRGPRYGYRHGGHYGRK